MATPNIVNVTSIIGKTEYISNVGTGLEAIVINGATSNKVYKIYFIR